MRGERALVRQRVAPAAGRARRSRDAPAPARRARPCPAWSPGASGSCSSEPIRQALQRCQLVARTRARSHKVAEQADRPAPPAPRSAPPRPGPRHARRLFAPRRACAPRCRARCRTRATAHCRCSPQRHSAQTARCGARERCASPPAAWRRPPATRSALSPLDGAARLEGRPPRWRQRALASTSAEAPAGTRRAARRLLAARPAHRHGHPQAPDQRPTAAARWPAALRIDGGLVAVHHRACLVADAVAQPAHGLDQLAAELAAQRRDMHLERVARDLAVEAEHQLLELGLRHDAPGAQHQGLEHAPIRAR